MPDCFFFFFSFQCFIYSCVQLPYPFAWLLLFSIPMSLLNTTTPFPRHFEQICVHLRPPKKGFCMSKCSALCGHLLSHVCIWLHSRTLELSVRTKNGRSSISKWSNCCYLLNKMGCVWFSIYKDNWVLLEADLGLRTRMQVVLGRAICRKVGAWVKERRSMWLSEQLPWATWGLVPLGKSGHSAEYMSEFSHLRGEEAKVVTLQLPTTTGWLLLLAWVTLQLLACPPVHGPEQALRWRGMDISVGYHWCVARPRDTERALAAVASHVGELLTHLHLPLSRLTNVPHPFCTSFWWWNP